MPPHPHTEDYSPLALIATLLLALLFFALFFIGFLVAPLAILVLFYIFFAASDRSRRASGTGFVAEKPPAVVEEPVVVVEERRRAPMNERAAYRAGFDGFASRSSETGSPFGDAGDPYRDGGGSEELGRFERRPVTVPETADERLAREAAMRRGQL